MQKRKLDFSITKSCRFQFEVVVFNQEQLLIILYLVPLPPYRIWLLWYFPFLIDIYKTLIQGAGNNLIYLKTNQTGPCPCADLIRYKLGLSPSQMFNAKAISQKCQSPDKNFSKYIFMVFWPGWLIFWFFAIWPISRSPGGIGV